VSPSPGGARSAARTRPAPTAPVLSAPVLTSPVLTALVLAGGAARRMGGSKAGLHVAGRSLLQASLDLAAELADETLLLGGTRRWPAPARGAPRRVPDWPSRARAADAAPDPPGPLAALGAGLEAARHDWCLLLACDMPFVTPEAIEALRAAAASRPAAGARRSAAPQAVLYRGTRGAEPFPGLYHRSALPQARALHAAGERSLQALIAALDTRFLDGGADGAPEARMLLNVNTPSDLRAARRRAGEPVP
jgi:molybdenum cofactor guanylyltransferase